MSRTTRFVPYCYRHPDSHYFLYLLGPEPEWVARFGNRGNGYDLERARCINGYDGGHKSGVGDGFRCGDLVSYGWRDNEGEAGKRFLKRRANRLRRAAGRAAIGAALSEGD